MEVTNLDPTSRSGHGGKSGKDGTDGSVILHGRHVVVDLVAGRFLPFSSRAEFDIGESSGRLRGPLQIFGAHPLHANGFANGLRQDHGFVFGASVAAVGSTVVACSGIGVNDRRDRAWCRASWQFRHASAWGFWLWV